MGVSSFSLCLSLSQVTEFINSHEMGSGKLASKQVIAAIKNHMSWLKTNGEKVQKWLKQQVDKNSKRSLIM